MNIAQARLASQGAERDPPVYRPMRLVSIYLSVPLARLHVSPDAITFVHLFLLLVAGTLIWRGLLVVSILVLVAAFIADCVDGEIARLRQRTSKLGTQLEQMTHWIGSGALVFGTTAYVAHLHPNAGWVWPTGLCAAIGWGTFHFNYNQLNLYADRRLDHSTLRRITWILYLGMPLDVNLVLLGLALDKLEWTIVGSAILSNCSVAASFSLYYRTERTGRSVVHAP